MKPAERLVGHATVTWGVLFAVVHADWAAGDDLGEDGAAGLAITTYFLLFVPLGWAQAVSSGQRPCSS